MFDVGFMLRSCALRSRPIPACVSVTCGRAKGEVVGKLYIQLEGEDVAEYPLVTLHEVKEGGLIDRMMDYVSLKLGLDD